ncbi:MAG: hypothetical protein HQM06_03330 [Magnetococcales bacterium]|nr:hypothetical protein [Magnetococcales bacterium]
MKVQSVWVRHAHLTNTMPNRDEEELIQKQRSLRQEIAGLLLRGRFVSFLKYPVLIFDNLLNCLWWLQGPQVAVNEIYNQLAGLKVDAFHNWELPSIEEARSLLREPLISKHPRLSNKPVYVANAGHDPLDTQVGMLGGAVAGEEGAAAGGGLLIPIHRVSQRGIFSFIVSSSLFPTGVPGLQEKLSTLYQLTMQLHTPQQEPQPPSIADLQQYLLEGDYLRARLPILEEGYLQDPKKGLWELYQTKPPLGKDWLEMVLPEPWEARNPERDLRKGVVAIDFGTSSTVVACREQGKTSLLRVGITDFFRKPTAEDYQNPTVIEWIHLPNLMAAWNTEAYRPMVRWDDFHFSHTALASYRQNEGDQRIVGSILTNIKQLPLLEKKQQGPLRVLDQATGSEREICVSTAQMPAHGQRISVSSSDPLDPIELYAYYLGLFINSRTNGLFLEYYMTFPVTYPRKVKKRILSSFARGLMRSLPPSLLDSPQLQQFSVREEASEPTAYAACALAELQIPASEEGTAFAVFDFGGGTTDFDFGIYRQARAREAEQGYEQVIEHFGASGDMYLGGENLVHHIAFLTFVQNLDVCRTAQISFTMPPEAELFPGHELCVDGSQTAQTNMALLIAKVRPLWENFQWPTAEGEGRVGQGGASRRRSDAISDILHRAILDTDFNLDPAIPCFSEEENHLSITIDLLNRKREKVPLKLLVDRNAINQFLVKRVGRGIYQFFIAMQQAFARRGPLPKEIRILQAGNSSRALLVQALYAMILQENMYRWTPVQGEERRNPVMEEVRRTLPLFDPQNGVTFIVHRPPEGSPKELYRPTAKTGVAIGLLRLIPGERVLAIHTTTSRQRSKSSDTEGEGLQPVVEALQESPFRLFVGGLVNGLFKPVLLQNDPYGEWHELGVPTRRAFPLIYSISPRAVFGQLARGLAELEEKNLTFPMGSEKKHLFIRAIAPTTVEICLADSLEQLHQDPSEIQALQVLELV